MKGGEVEIFSSDPLLKARLPLSFLLIYGGMGLVIVCVFIVPIIALYYKGGMDLVPSAVLIFAAMIPIILMVINFKTTRLGGRKKGPIDLTEVHDEYIRLITRKTMTGEEFNERSYNNPLECMDIPLPQIRRIMKDSSELQGLPIREATNPDRPGKDPDWRIFIELESPLRKVSLSEEPVMYHRRINTSYGHWAVIPIEPKDQDKFIATVMKKKESLGPARSKRLMEKVQRHDLLKDIELSRKYDNQPRWKKVFPTSLEKRDIRREYLRSGIRYSTVAFFFTVVLGLIFGSIYAYINETTGADSLQYYINSTIGGAIFSFTTLILMIIILIVTRQKYLPVVTSNTHILVDNWFVYIFIAEMDRNGGADKYMNFFQREMVINIEPVDKAKMKKYRTLNPIISFFLPKNYTNISFHNDFTPIEDLVLVRLKRPFYFEHTERITNLLKPFDNLVMSNEVIIEVPRSVRDKFRETVFRKWD